jgi:hypothetical protein
MRIQSSTIHIIIAALILGVVGGLTSSMLSEHIYWLLAWPLGIFCGIISMILYVLIVTKLGY